MANIPPIQFKRSETPGAVPNPADMLPGEIAINIADQKIFTKDSDGVIKNMGFHTKRNNIDEMHYVDAAGAVTSSGRSISEITVITDTADNNWQNSQEVLDLEPGTKINVFRKAEDAEYFTESLTANTHIGMTTAGSAYVAILNYGGVASYAASNSIYNDTYRAERAYVSGGDHASIGQRNNYFMFQVFENPVSIGNGATLGTFKNGRATEYFATARLEFYDTNGDLIVGATFTNTSSRTNNINLGGTINNVKTIIMRGDDAPATSGNPGLNNINFYVNNSTAYPTTSWTTNQKWAVMWANIGNCANPRPPAEFIAISHVSTNVSGFAAGGMWSLSRPVDAALALNATGGTYIFWLNKPWAVAGGTWRPGRGPFPTEYYRDWAITYSDGTNAQLLTYNRTFSTSANLDTFYAYRGVHKIMMAATVRQGTYPSLNDWFPRLSIPNEAATIEESFTEPEVWFRTSDKSVDIYVDNEVGQVAPFKKVI